ncbi:hypothetical protein D3C74_219910 [compost metagenome]
MWESIAKLVGDNPITTLVITIIGTSTIWLYKEFKEMIDRNTTTKITVVNEKIKLFSQLQINIVATIHESENNQLRLGLVDKFGEYSIFLSEDARRIWLDYIRKDDPSYLVSLLAFISVELKKLDKEKGRLLTNNSSTDIEGFILKLIDPIKPIFIVWVLVWFGLLLFVTYNEQHTWYGKFNVITVSFTVFVSFTSAYPLFTLKLQEQLSRQGKYRWFLYICLIAAPLLSIIYMKLSIFSLFIQIVAILLLVQRKRSEKNLIITKI